MPDEGQENGASSGPLIFTIPVLGFVVALKPDRIDRASPAAVSEKSTDELACRCPENPPTTGTKNYATR